jgi:hypothetical protein
MKTLGLLAAVLLALSAQTPTATSAPMRHLVYEFGFNTKVASSGNGTGTETIDIVGPAKDGGVIVTGTDSWWNTVRPRATNTCELYAGGGVSCTQPPYALSPIQVTIFPLLAHGYFKGLSSAATSAWKRSYQVKAAIVPGASGFAGQLGTWNCTYSIQGKGPIANAAPMVLVQAQGTLEQQGGRYLKASSKQRIAYDPVAQLPVIVSDTRTHLPMKSVYSNDLVELKLMKDSQAKH